MELVMDKPSQPALDVCDQSEDPFASLGARMF